jgi:hypothetical protein
MPCLMGFAGIYCAKATARPQYLIIDLLILADDIQWISDFEQWIVPLTTFWLMHVIICKM